MKGDIVNGDVSTAERPGAVVLVGRPGSMLEGSLWHPDPSVLSGQDARRTLLDIKRARSFLAALEALAVERIRLACEEEARGVAERQQQDPGRGPERFDGALAHALAVSEVAVAEGISEYAAARLLNVSEQLCGPQIEALEFLESGDLTEAHARALADEASSLPDDVAEEFGVLALAKLETRKGRRRTAAEFRRAVRELRERMHPESIRVRKAKAARDRCVTFKPEPDGMCTVSAFLTAEVGLAAFSRLDGLARAQQGSAPDEGRTLPQLRADALAGLVLADRGRASAAREGAAFPVPGCPVPEVAPPAAEIVVHVPVAALLGASDEPATLEGYGLLDAETARELAVAAPTWQRLLVGGDGVPLSLGRTVYRPPKGLRRFIRYRDGTCLFPCCTRPAIGREVDHIVEWQAGGTTDAPNLQSLCRKHHALKSLGLWKAQRLRAAGGGTDEGGLNNGGSDEGGLNNGGSDDAGTEDILWVSPLGGRILAGPQEREVPAGSIPSPESVPAKAPPRPSVPTQEPAPAQAPVAARESESPEDEAPPPF